MSRKDWSLNSSNDLVIILLFFFLKIDDFCESKAKWSIERKIHNLPFDILVFKVHTWIERRRLKDITEKTMTFSTEKMVFEP